jgi:hypothetical protein
MPDGCQLCEDGPEVSLSVVMVVILYIVACAIYGFISSTYWIGVFIFNLIK